MANSIPPTHADLLKPETRAFASLALVTSKGEPHVTPMWFDYDGQDIIFNTARGRVKDHILAKQPPVAVAIVDPHNPYRYIQIRGHVVSGTDAGGYEQICELNQKYHGNRNYPQREGEVRVTYRVRPEHVTTMG